LAYVHGDWGVSLLPSMMANVGVIENTTVGGVSVFEKNGSGKVPGQGAKGRTDPAYRGEVFLTSGGGRAAITRWTPNEVVVQVEDAKEGDLLVMNQNYDRGWRANGETAIAYEDTIATPIAAPTQVVTFRYWPRGFGLGMAILGTTMAAIAATWHFNRLRGKGAD
jgi:hypothetical protein